MGIFKNAQGVCWKKRKKIHLHPTAALNSLDIFLQISYYKGTVVHMQVYDLG